MSQELLIFKMICKNLHEICDSVFCCIPSCDFYKVNRLLLRIDNRFTSFYSNLLEFKEIFDKK